MSCGSTDCLLQELLDAIEALPEDDCVDHEIIMFCDIPPAGAWSVPDEEFATAGVTDWPYVSWNLTGTFFRDHTFSSHTVPIAFGTAGQIVLTPDLPGTVCIEITDIDVSEVVTITSDAPVNVVETANAGPYVVTNNDTTVVTITGAAAGQNGNSNVATVCMGAAGTTMTITCVGQLIGLRNIHGVVTETNTAFLRRYSVDALGVVTTTDTLLDGVTPYVVVEGASVCP
jgi:hypothetical protein